MPFRGRNKDKQRKAMFARMSTPSQRRNNQIVIVKRKQPFKKKFLIAVMDKKGKREIFEFKSKKDRSNFIEEIDPKLFQIATSETKRLSNTKDSDGDGVPDRKDCEPFNPKKQGALHDFKMKRLRALEEKAERKREKEQKKLQDLKDELQARRNIAQTKTSIKEAKLRAKQSFIDEIKREKDKIRDLKRQNKEAKKALFETSAIGKATKTTAKVGSAAAKGSVKAIQATDRFFQKKSTKRFFKKLGKIKLI